MCFDFCREASPPLAARLSGEGAKGAQSKARPQSTLCQTSLRRPLRVQLENPKQPKFAAPSVPRRVVTSFFGGSLSLRASPSEERAPLARETTLCAGAVYEFIATLTYYQARERQQRRRRPRALAHSCRDALFFFLRCFCLRCALRV